MLGIPGENMDLTARSKWPDKSQCSLTHGELSGLTPGFAHIMARPAYSLASWELAQIQNEATSQ